MTPRRRVLMILGMGAVAAIAMAATAYLGGLRFNLTPSYTLGIWRIVPLDREVVVGDLIFHGLLRGRPRTGLSPTWPLSGMVQPADQDHSGERRSACRGRPHDRN